MIGGIDGCGWAFLKLMRHRDVFVGPVAADGEPSVLGALHFPRSRAAVEVGTTAVGQLVQQLHLPRPDCVGPFVVDVGDPLP
jgi:hypothetical protein